MGFDDFDGKRFAAKGIVSARFAWGYKEDNMDNAGNSVENEEIDLFFANYSFGAFITRNRA